ncbi:MAG: NDP-sugar synthase [Candidatus Peregrinibacteria bacterium]|nr:NDP-sugar synthase [Candidatus Peregrinibacteria bacterium]
MKILILAGGFATRLWPLTEKRAKPLLLLDGKTILAHILDKIPKEDGNLETILLTNKKFAGDFENELAKLGRRDVKIFCEDAHSDNEKVGALGAVSLAINEFKINDNILILAGDNLLPDLKIEQLFCENDSAKLAVREVKDFYEARKFGVVEVGPDSEYGFEVVDFEEKPEEPKSKLVSTGFCAIGKDLFPFLHEFAQKNPDALGAIFADLLNNGKSVFAEKVTGHWFDVGSFETYLEAHKMLQGEDLKLGKKVVQDGNKFSGKVSIGDGCEVKNCRILNSIVYPGCKLENCRISETIIDENCDFTGVDLNRKLVRKRTRLYNF